MSTQEPPSPSSADITPTHGKCAVISTRELTNCHEKDGTIDEQLEVLRAVARQHGLIVVDEVRDDGISDGISMSDRSGAEKLMGLITSGEVDIVLVSDMYLVFRDPDVVAVPLLRKALRDAGVALWTRNGEVNDNSPESQLMQGLLRLTAEYERKRMQRRSGLGPQRPRQEK